MNITITVGTDTRPCTFERWARDNYAGMSAKDLATIRRDLAAAGVYHGGGGADAAYVLRLDASERPYDIIHLADDEWDNDTMRRIASEWFASHPACEFVEVHEHGGWWLGYRRDHSIWSTANDCAVCHGTKPTTFSGICYRRTAADITKEAAA